MKQKYYRRFFLLLAMLLAVTFANAQIIVEASETVELMAILSRTAGFREYYMDMGGQYTKVSGLVAGSRYHTTFGIMSHRYWFASQFRIVALLYSCKKLVHVNMDDFHALLAFYSYLLQKYSFYF